MDKKYLPSVVILYLNYFIHGIGCSLLSQQVVKEMLAAQWGVGDVMTVTAVNLRGRPLRHEKARRERPDAENRSRRSRGGRRHFRQFGARFRRNGR